MLDLKSWRLVVNLPPSATTDGKAGAVLVNLSELWEKHGTSLRLGSWSQEFGGQLQIVLPKGLNGVSRQHCDLLQDPGGNVTVKDMSKFHTYVGSLELKDGESISIRGRSLLKFGPHINAELVPPDEQIGEADEATHLYPSSSQQEAETGAPAGNMAGSATAAHSIQYKALSTQANIGFQGHGHPNPGNGNITAHSSPGGSSSAILGHSGVSRLSPSVPLGSQSTGSRTSAGVPAGNFRQPAKPFQPARPSRIMENHHREQPKRFRWLWLAGISIIAVLAAAGGYAVWQDKELFSSLFGEKHLGLDQVELHMEMTLPTTKDILETLDKTP